MYARPALGVCLGTTWNLQGKKERVNKMNVEHIHNNNIKINEK